VYSLTGIDHGAYNHSARILCCVDFEDWLATRSTREPRSRGPEELLLLGAGSQMLCILADLAALQGTNQPTKQSTVLQPH
jgi:hypothetical protein